MSAQLLAQFPIPPPHHPAPPKDGWTVPSYLVLPPGVVVKRKAKRQNSQSNVSLKSPTSPRGFDPRLDPRGDPRNDQRQDQRDIQRPDPRAQDARSLDRQPRQLQQQQQQPPNQQQQQPGQQLQKGPNPLAAIFVDRMPDTIFPQSAHIHVPRQLATLRQILNATDGLRAPGVFRDKGSESELKSIRDKVSKPGATASSVRTRDSLAVASAIKMFFRDLPVQLCNEIPAQAIMETKDPQRAWIAAMRMHPMNRDLLEWVIDLILMTASQEPSNGMGIRSLCTVWAPNLYGPDPNDPDPVKFMSVSIQMVSFLGLLVTKRKADLGV